jgi:hypothetical protein
MLDSMTTAMMYHTGLDGFVWFVGIVEQRDSDPLNVGRCKVRILGHHDLDTRVLPTEDLPWALPLLPLTQSRGVPDIREGDWVCGFFLDAHLAQQPVLLGKFPSYPTDSNVGSQKT